MKTIREFPEFLRIALVGVSPSLYLLSRVIQARMMLNRAVRRVALLWWCEMDRSEESMRLAPTGPARLSFALPCQL